MGKKKKKKKFKKFSWAKKLLASVTKRGAWWTSPEVVKLLMGKIEKHEKLFEKEQLRTTNSLNFLAEKLYDQGRYAETDSLYRRMIESHEKLLRRINLDLANSLSNLAEMLHDQGKYTEAESLYRRALRTREQHLGPYNPNKD